MKLQLIDNWRDGWKFWSVKVAALLAVLEALELAVNAVVESGAAPAILESQAFGCLKLFLMVMIPVLRLVQQKSLVTP